MKRLFVLLLICCGGYIATSTAQNYYLTSVANPQDSWLTIDNKTITLPAEAGTGYVQLKTNLSVSVSSRPTWLVVSQTSKGVLRIVRKANTSANARTGNIVLTAKDGKTLTLNMVQVGKDCENRYKVYTCQSHTTTCGRAHRIVVYLFKSEAK